VWSKGEFHAQLRAIGSILLPAALKKLFPLMNNVLIHELCHRAGFDSHRVVAEVSDEEILKLLETSEQIVRELESARRPRIYFENSAPVQFSPVPLEHLRHLKAEVFDSVHEAVRIFVGTSRRQKTLLQEKDALLSYLRQGAERAERTLQKMERETETLRRALQHELMGKVIMAHLPELRKGMREAMLQNVFSEDRESLVVPLEEKLNPAQNADRYFEKAKHARAGVQEKLSHQEDVRERWEAMRELLDRLADLHSREQIEEFINANREQLTRLGFKGAAGANKEEKEEAPFRSFTVAGGFQVWVGKSSENNDLLTHKYARPADLWFHARGSSGSHVVLRIGTGKGEPSRRAIEEAAGIAAFYSKMKTAKHVPVAVTERKFVRKPRGAPAGTVTIEREKLLFVTPGLPKEVEPE
jgi:predicted ribosome quality control (RQC) complex YloA/Tae2 family protein